MRSLSLSAVGLQIRRLAGLLLVMLAVVSAGAGVSSGEDFTRTVAVARGSRLDVRLFGGEVVVRGSARSDVRVHATHFRSDRIDVQVTPRGLVVRARSEQGSPHAIDLDIDVPSWMPVAVAGTYVDIAISDTRADISAETVRGDVRARGGAGTITLKSIEGDVVLDGAEGKAEIHAVNNGVRVAGFRGDLFVDTVNGGVKLEAIRSSSVVVGTVGGDVWWDGPMSDTGRYQFATHYGDIDVQAPPRANVAVSVRLFDGQFRSTEAAAAAAALDKRKRFSFVLGSGSAQLDLETFRGVISLRRSSN
jgi:hypothetical protein